MVIDATLELPAHIAAGLLTNQMVRRGGVIQWAKGTPTGGQIVAWLREVSAQPIEAAALARPLAPQIANLLGLVGSVSSVLNLGATVAFGVATIRRLDALQGSVDHLTREVGRLQWAVDFGFFNVGVQLDRVVSLLEHGVAAKLRAGADLAWAAQQLDPTSPQRISQMANALQGVAEAAEVLLTLAEREGGAVEVSMLADLPDKSSWPPGKVRPPRGEDRLRHLDSLVGALGRARQAFTALHLRSMLLAETGQLAAAASLYATGSERLGNTLRRLLRAFLIGRGEDVSMYGLLLRNSPEDDLPWATIERWASSVDPRLVEHGGQPLAAVLRRALPDAAPVDYERVDIRHGEPERVGFSLDKFGLSRVSRRKDSIPADGVTLMDRRDPFAQQLRGEAWPAVSVARVAALFEGLREDVARADGTVAELEFVGSSGLSLQAYRQSLLIEDQPAGALVFLTPRAA